MLDGIDHVAIAVRDIEEARRTFDALFGAPGAVEEVADQKVRTCFYDVGGVHIELVEPTSPDSPIAKFLEKRGGGIHHIAFRTTDLEGALAQLSEKGFRLIDHEPRAGAGGKKIAFLHPASTHKVLMELCRYDA